MQDPTKVQDVAVTINSRLNDLLKKTIDKKTSVHYEQFDLAGRPIMFICVTNDAPGITNLIEAYGQSRDRYANEVANAVAADIAKNGLPDPNNPKAFNIVTE